MATTRSVERLGLDMASPPEYDLRELGPWDRDSDTHWCAPDPFSNGVAHVWWDSGTGMYWDCSGAPICFAGVHLQRRGFPLADVESDVGTPEAQWEADFRAYDREAWFAYRNTGEWRG